MRDDRLGDSRPLQIRGLLSRRLAISSFITYLPLKGHDTVFDGLLLAVALFFSGITLALLHQ
jgi:hypothetical protein